MLLAREELLKEYAQEEKERQEAVRSGEAFKAMTCRFRMEAIMAKLGGMDVRRTNLVKSNVSDNYYTCLKNEAYLKKTTISQILFDMIKARYDNNELA